MKKILLLCFAIFSFVQSCTNRKKTTSSQIHSIYNYKVKGIDGKTIDFSDFKGKKILIVNTASECGFTPQYADLEKLYQQYKNQLVVVGFPANNFGSQEPGNNLEIATFCTKNYGVTFPMAAKVSVKGDSIEPLFEFLTQKEYNGVKNTTILWNFTKFLVDENGTLIDSFLSTTKPTDTRITQYLQPKN